MKSAIFTRADPSEETPVDAETVLDNVVELERLLDDGSRREVDTLPVLELSKHMRVRVAVKASGDEAPAAEPLRSTATTARE